MANNVAVTQGVGTIFKTTDTAGVHTGHVNVDSSALPTGAATSAKQDTAQTALDAIKTAAELLDNAVAGTELQVDVVAPLPAGTNAIGKVDHSSTGIGHGVTTVTTAGTDVALAGSTAAKWVTIQAQTDNTNKIAVGATGVDATVATGTGVLLDPGDSITLPVDNLADVFIDALVSGEGVRYVYGT